MKAAVQAGTLIEKASSGWWSGCNSIKMPWLMPDTQYRWGINITNRGGIPQTRPGYRLRLTLPPGNVQGLAFFKPTKTKSKIGPCLVAAVSGTVYAVPFPLVNPRNAAEWLTHKVDGVSFDPNAKQVYWESAEKSVLSDAGGELRITPTYSVLMMQDGVKQAAYFDGELSAHLNENARETPRGTWMKWTGDRLWVARDTAVLASDEADPLNFKERLTGAARNDFKFAGPITGLGSTTGTNRQSNLVVFTTTRTETLQSSIRNREQWLTTANFQAELYPSLGCISGRSIFNHAGLLWWYSFGGLVSSDSAQANFLTSEIKYRDVEMGFSKRNLAPDLSGICGTSFENYLLVSQPSGDPLNAHTMVMDYAIANETYQVSPPAWNSIWTGTRPVEWATSEIDREKRLFHVSVDYQSLGGSFNHVWEAFQSDRMDSYEIIDDSNATTLVQNPIYCMFETKLFGDGMDIKKFAFAEIDAIEIGGTVNVRVGYGGNKGAYENVATQNIIATLNANGSDNADLHALFDRIGPFRPQSRRITTVEPNTETEEFDSVEQNDLPCMDKSFGLRVEWCGRMGIEALRIFMRHVAEKSVGACSPAETGIKVVTVDGESFSFDI